MQPRLVTDHVPRARASSREPMEATEGHDGVASNAPEAEEDGIVLDPEDSERQYYQDPFTALQREIWRPGDGDGDRASDYFDKPGGPPPIASRWRFYQSQTGSGPVKRDVNEPPKYVILDDRAAYEVFASDMPRNSLTKFWPHDFGGPGKLRHRRPHRGRGAIGDPDAEGDDKYHFERTGAKDDKYYFTGQPDYKPITYRTSGAEAPTTKDPTPPPRKAPSLLDDLPKSRTHGHNQYTPKDQLVKYGAPHFGTTYMRYRPRLNAFLKRDPSPERASGRARYFAQGTKRRTQGLFDTDSITPPVATDDEPSEEAEEGESLWVEPDDPVARKRQKRETQFEPVDPSQADQDGSSEMEEFPFPRPPTNTISIGGTASPEPDIPPPSRRKKLPKQDDFFSRFLAEQEATNDEEPALVTNDAVEISDGASYASPLEQELLTARKTIADLRTQIERLEGSQEKSKNPEAQLSNALEGPDGDEEWLAQGNGAAE